MSHFNVKPAALTSSVATMQKWWVGRKAEASLWASDRQRVCTLPKRSGPDGRRPQSIAGRQGQKRNQCEAQGERAQFMWDKLTLLRLSSFPRE